MGRHEIRPYDPSLLSQAAELLAAARGERLLRCPLLPSALADPASARELLLSRTDGAVALTEAGGLLGFLLPERRDDPMWGASLCVDIDGWGFEAGSGSASLARLYAAAFGPMTAGVAEHRIYCPAFDTEALDAWFHLGFGMEQAYAVARLDELDTRQAVDEGLSLRRAGAGDEDALVGLSDLIARTQAGAPVWAGAPPAYLASLREGFKRLATDKEAIVLLAFRAGRAVGYQAWFPMESQPKDGGGESCIELSVGATIGEERGRGVGLALTARGVSEALRAGHRICYADWRTTNPLSSAFWAARGFKPFSYRLVRRLCPEAVADLGATAS